MTGGGAEARGMPRPASAGIDKNWVAGVSWPVSGEIATGPTRKHETQEPSDRWEEGIRCGGSMFGIESEKDSAHPTPSAKHTPRAVLHIGTGSPVSPFNSESLPNPFRCER